ncbi:CRISPR-associated helicase Cas3' [Roseomonas mucosa]|uniref:CRISPR-associated helicase Cas3' n=1 Tax=Roseomonas mucosa TaxID=207340 RepID=UPI00384F436A
MTLDECWAKLRRECRENRDTRCRRSCDCPVTGFLSLVGHSADVAAVMWILLQQPVIRRRLTMLLGKTSLTDADCAHLAAATALHDIGKIGQGFQRAPFSAVDPGDRGHVGTFLSLLERADGEVPGPASRALAALCDAGGLGRFRLIINGPDGFFEAVLAHHGRLPKPAGQHERIWRARDGYDPVRACRALTDAIHGWFGEAATEGDPPSTPRFNHAFAGLLTLADWLASDEVHFPLRAQGNPPAPDGPDRFAWACGVARRLLEQRLLIPTRARQACAGLSWDIGSLFDFATASAGQEAMLRLDPAPAQGRIVLIEDETGSGKTEAALLHFLRLFAEGAVDGMYFALPTRAAAVQLHGRLEKALRRLLRADAPPVILAVPGYLGRPSQNGELPDEAALYPDEARQAHWAAERPKRYLAACVAVGTIDQALMGGLKVKHAQLRSAAMLRLLLVVDEVHSSDVYMAAILRNLLDQHQAAGGHALLLSATLGAAARMRLLAPDRRVDPPSHPEAATLPYPAVWTGPGAPVPDEDRRQAAPKAVRVVLEPGWESPEPAMARAVAAAQQGARVLVIRNTVRGVVEAQEALERIAPELSLAVEGPRGPVLAPHHARYAPEDRVRLDQALEAVLGNNAPRERGSVTIASQTAEQSLDIDADLLVTDLCPADVLLQRLGRLHRKPGRPRPPGYETPCAIVVAPPEAALAAALQANGEVRNPPLALGLVYPDLIGVLATRQALGAGVVTVPCDNRRLVEAATHPEALETLARGMGDRWLRHWCQVIGSRGAMAQAARLALLDWGQPIQPLPHDLGEIKVRLGLEDRRVDLVDRPIGPFGGTISALTVPGRWLKGVDAEAVPAVEPQLDGSLTIRFEGVWLSYDRLGLRLAAPRAS